MAARSAWALALVLTAGCGARTGFSLDPAGAGGQPVPPGPQDAAPSEDGGVSQGRVFLFGGVGTSVLDDVWTWDGTTWTEQHPSTSPEARASASAATLGGTTFIFGGDDNGRLFGDLWKWNGATWAQETATRGPSSRWLHAMAAMDNAIVLFGGEDKSFTPMADTWTWDGTSWILASRTASPSPRRAHAMATVARAGSDAQSRVVLFGGSVPPSDVFGDTWTWDGATWEQENAAPSPAARDSHAMATLGDTVVLFGGASATAALNDTWTWDGARWTPRSPAISPPARQAHAMATLGRKVVLFGGRDREGNALDDTWEWDGATWTQAHPPTSPPARADHVMSGRP
jgi:hypothetical protein